MLKDLKPRTKVISNRDTLITILFCNFPNVSSFFTLAEQKKQYIMSDVGVSKSF